MAWHIRFVPLECDSVSITLENQEWTTLFRTGGEQQKTLPPPFVNQSPVKIGVATRPEGKNAYVQIFWDDRAVQDINTDNYEDQTVYVPLPPAPPHQHDTGHDGGGHGGMKAMTTKDDLDIQTAQMLDRDFKSPVRQNHSLGSPVVSQGRLDELRSPAESKTFTTWQFLPWQLLANAGNTLLTLDDIALTVYRALDSASNPVVKVTITFRQTANGYYIPSPRNPSVGLAFQIYFLNSAGGTLELWSVDSSHVVACRDNGAFCSYSKTVNPDWYGIYQAAELVFVPAQWLIC